MADPKGVSNLFQEVHNASLMLWQSLANALLTANVIQRHELVDAIEATVEEMGEDATGLPEQIAQSMKAMILNGVEPLPEIDPATSQTIKDIAAGR